MTNPPEVSGGGAISDEAEKRFWTKVERRGPDECWPWLGGVNQGGYGQFTIGRRRRPAHRIAYALEHGAEPEGFILDHICHDPTQCRLANQCPHRRCCNPSHLVATTPKGNSNNQRAYRPESEVTHCPSGHPYSGPNLMVKPSGERACRTCNRQGALSYWRRVGGPKRAKARAEARAAREAAR